MPAILLGPLGEILQHNGALRRPVGAFGTLEEALAACDEVTRTLTLEPRFAVHYVGPIPYMYGAKLAEFATRGEAESYTKGDPDLWIKSL